MRPILLLSLILLVFLTAGCATATRFEDPAEFLGISDHQSFKLLVEGEQDDDCTKIIRLECENAMLKKQLEDCGSTEPELTSFTIPQPPLQVTIRR